KYFSEPVSARLVSGYLRRNDPTTDSCPRITEREREVLTRIALGDSNKRVALALRLSVKTVEKHRANLMRKLELHNTAAVTLFAWSATPPGSGGVGLTSLARGELPLDARLSTHAGRAGREPHLPAGHLRALAQVSHPAAGAHRGARGRSLDSHPVVGHFQHQLVPGARE